MNHLGQHRHPLFTEIDESRPKLFTLEVSAPSTLYVLEAFEKAIVDLRKGILSFSYEGPTCKKMDGASATFRYTEGGCLWCSGNIDPAAGKSVKVSHMGALVIEFPLDVDLCQLLENKLTQ